MPLTDAELRNLTEISDDVRRVDPRLARGLARGTMRPRVVDVVTAVVAVVLITALAVGITCQLRVLCAVAWSVGLAAAIVRAMYADGGY